ncbi:MAG TPA: ATP-binding protein [Verrucomicrobiae bacterium]|nr:ATP-binding protein [Verrucomicrobiae bacterium]
MELKRGNTWVYGLLLGVWLLVVAWQVEEHARIEAAAKNDLRNRSWEIADTLSAEVRALSIREVVFQNRLQPVLNELVSRTNQYVPSTGVLSIALLNTAGEPLVTAGNPNLIPADVLSEGEHWTSQDVTFVNPVWGASINTENTSNAPVVLPFFPEMTNGMRRGEADNDRHFPPPEDMNLSNRPAMSANAQIGPPPPPDDNRPHGNGPRRPPWMRWMDEDQFKALAARRELHGLVLAMSTENLRAVSTDDLYLRAVIIFFAGISALGVGLAWRNLSKTSELQIRLVRASELNTHLKEMNLAAAGLAHETRNPLNIIRGMAQMMSKSDAPSGVREKARAIVDETDKVTAQLNEFINYSRPREVRRTKIALNSAVAEVVHALDYDIAEKKIRVESRVEKVFIEADEQLLRQALFNLLLNAVQAVGENGQIQFTAQRNGAEAALEIRDDGPGVRPEQRDEIFKPYFTTHQKGTGLGLAVVQQIVQAHGWEIQCMGNEPKGAVFRISHLKLAGN